MNDLAAETTVAPTLDECAVAGVPVPAGVAERPALLLARLGTVLTEVADAQLAETGVSGRDYAILAILTVDAPESQFELARLLGKAPGVVVSAVDRLEAAGLVERRRDPADRRRSRVVVTDAGRATLVHADALAARVLAELLPGLGEADRTELGRLLVRGIGA